MRDEAHVGLVDPHAERDRRHHEKAVLLQEGVLVAVAIRRGQPAWYGSARKPSPASFSARRSVALREAQ
jgi:hypothetical protein